MSVPESSGNTAAPSSRAPFKHSQFEKARDAHKNIVERFQKRVLVQKVLEEHEKKIQLRQKSEQYVQYRNLLDKVRNPPSAEESAQDVERSLGSPNGGEVLVSDVNEAKLLLLHQREERRQAEAEEFEKLMEARRAAKKANSRLSRYTQKKQKYIFHEEKKPLPPPKPRPPRFPKRRKATQKATSPKPTKTRRVRRAKPAASTTRPHHSKKHSTRHTNKSVVTPQKEDSPSHVSPALQVQSPNPAEEDSVQNILNELAAEDYTVHEDYTEDGNENFEEQVPNEDTMQQAPANAAELHPEAYGSSEKEAAMGEEEDEEDVDKTNVDDVLNDILHSKDLMSSGLPAQLEASEMQALQNSMSPGQAGNEVSGQDSEEEGESGWRLQRELYAAVSEEIEALGGGVEGISGQYHTSAHQLDQISNYF